MHEIIAVHDGDPIALGEGERPVAGRARPAILLASKKANARIVAHGLGDDPDAVIGRRIIRDDELELAQALTAHRCDGLGQIGAGVVVGHDDADDRRCVPKASVHGRASRRDLVGIAHGGLTTPVMDEFGDDLADLGEKPERPARLHCDRGDSRGGHAGIAQTQSQHGPVAEA